MKKFYVYLALCLIVCLLCGCADKEITFAEPAIEVTKSGKISQTLVERFDKDYYDLNELRAEFENSVNEFSGGADKIKIIDMHVDNGDVFVSIDYDSWDDMSAFLGEQVFYGTVSEAYDKGCPLDVSLKSVSNGSIISKNELMDMSKNHIFIVPTKGLVYVGSKVLYTSANVEVLEDKKVRVSSDSDGLAYIIMK